MFLCAGPGQRYYEIRLWQPKTLLTICHVQYVPTFTDNGNVGSIFHHPFTTGKSNPKYNARNTCKTLGLIFLSAKVAKLTAGLSTWPVFRTWCPKNIIWWLVHTDSHRVQHDKMLSQHSTEICTMWKCDIFTMVATFWTIFRHYVPRRRSNPNFDARF